MKKNKKVIITTSWDDGHELDLKLAELLRKYKIPATFYIPLNSKKQKIISINDILKLNKTFEIGSHTKTHLNLAKATSNQAIKDVLGGKEGLEEILQHKVSMFSYPFGSYSKEVISIVKSAGFVGARNTKIFCTNFTKNKFEIGTTVHASDHPFSFYFQQILGANISLFLHLLSKGALQDWENTSNESLKYVVKQGGIWHLWGHSWEIERNNDWKKLERVFQNISQVKQKNPEIALLTNSGLIRTIM